MRFLALISSLGVLVSVLVMMRGKVETIHLPANWHALDAMVGIRRCIAMANDSKRSEAIFEPADMLVFLMTEKSLDSCCLGLNGWMRMKPNCLRSPFDVDLMLDRVGSSWKISGNKGSMTFPDNENISDVQKALSSVNWMENLLDGNRGQGDRQIFNKE